MAEPAEQLNIVDVADPKAGRTWQCVNYDNVVHVPREAWRQRWPNFPPEEVRCRGTGAICVAVDLLDGLQRMRGRLGGKPMVLRSVYRSARHNRRVGGARQSRHLISTGADVAMANWNPGHFEAAARAEGFKGFGYYRHKGFMHIDLGPARSWGRPWPANDNVDFAPEASVKPIARSRTILGAATAAVATAAQQAVTHVAEVAPEAEAALREQQDNLLLLGVPIEWIGSVLAVLAVIGAGLAIWARVDDRRQGRN